MTEPSKDFRALLAGAKLPEATVSICLRGDLVADHEAAERELERAQRNTINSLEGSGAGDIADRIAALEEQMREHTYEFRLRALPRAKWHELVGQHPPRRDEAGDVVEADRFILVNVETFWDAIIRACVVDPELSEDDWRQLEASLTDHAFQQLCDAAWGINRRGVSIPFSRAASQMRSGSAGE